MWNLLYDDVLKIDRVDEAKTLAVADDLAVIVEGKDKIELVNDMGNKTLKIIAKWMDKHKLTLAFQRQKAVLLKEGGTNLP